MIPALLALVEGAFSALLFSCHFHLGLDGMPVEEAFRILNPKISGSLTVPMMLRIVQGTESFTRGSNFFLHKPPVHKCVASVLHTPLFKSLLPSPLIGR